MARALVVFESLFGNTEQVARAVADGLGRSMQVDVRRAAPDVVVDDDVDLVVVGGPTHAFGMSRPGTRSAAAEQGAPVAVAASPGLREWVDGWRPGAAHPLVAAFDTRVKKRGVPGSAARSAERRLRRRGLPVAAPATSFWVDGTPGPLRAGEQDRARRWGEQLAEVRAAGGTGPGRPRAAGSPRRTDA